MQLENYTNINIFKRAFEQKEIANHQSMIEHSHNHIKAAGDKQHAGFNPYQNNEGTVIGTYSSHTRDVFINQKLFSYRWSRFLHGCYWH